MPRELRCMIHLHPDADLRMGQAHPLCSHLTAVVHQHPPPHPAPFAAAAVGGESLNHALPCRHANAACWLAWLGPALPVDHLLPLSPEQRPSQGLVRVQDLRALQCCLALSQQLQLCGCQGPALQLPQLLCLVQDLEGLRGHAQGCLGYGEMLTACQAQHLSVNFGLSGCDRGHSAAAQQVVLSVHGSAGWLLSAASPLDPAAAAAALGPLGALLKWLLGEGWCEGVWAHCEALRDWVPAAPAAS